MLLTGCGAGTVGSLTIRRMPQLGCNTNQSRSMAALLSVSGIPVSSFSVEPAAHDEQPPPDRVNAPPPQPAAELVEGGKMVTRTGVTEVDDDPDERICLHSSRSALMTAQPAQKTVVPVPPPFQRQRGL
jgi:hypothetical protein